MLGFLGDKQFGQIDQIGQTNFGEHIEFDKQFGRIDQIGEFSNLIHRFG